MGVRSNLLFYRNRLSRKMAGPLILSSWLKMISSDWLDEAARMIRALCLDGSMSWKLTRTWAWNCLWTSNSVWKVWKNLDQKVWMTLSTKKLTNTSRMWMLWPSVTTTGSVPLSLAWLMVYVVCLTSILLWRVLVRRTEQNGAHGYQLINTFFCVLILLAADLHSGVFGGTIHEPMSDLFAVMSKLVQPDGKILVPGVYDQVRAVTGKNPLVVGSTRHSPISIR